MANGHPFLFLPHSKCIRCLCLLFLKVVWSICTLVVILIGRTSSHTFHWRYMYLGIYCLYRNHLDVKQLHWFAANFETKNEGKAKSIYHKLKNLPFQLLWTPATTKMTGIPMPESASNILRLPPHGMMQI